MNLNLTEFGVPGRLVFIIILLLILTILAINGQAQEDGWEKQNSNTLENIYDIDFADSLNGWFVGSGGIVFHTGDGGDNWLPQNSGVQSNLNAVNFVDTQWGYAAGDGGIILHTDNGGSRWEILPSGTTEDFSEILFLTRDLGWAIEMSSPVNILRTTNGGQSWSPAALNTSFPALSLFAIDENSVLGCGGFYDWIGFTTVTNNGGTSWQQVVPIASEPIFDIFFLNASHGFAVGGDIDYGASAWESTDGAETWTQINAPLVLQPLFALEFMDQDTAWSCGAAGGLYKFISTTREWKEYQSQTPYNIYEMDFVDESHGWICGGNGYVAKYHPLIIGIKDDFTPVPQNIRLFQNYPNPFNSATKIEFEIARRSRVRLTIYDLTGRVIATLLPESSVLPGRRHVEWSGRNDAGVQVSSGLYISELKINGHSLRKKILLVR